MPTYLTTTPGSTIRIARPGSRPVAHVFEHDAIHATNAALAARRPLLVRGEPGTGKSQLARAVAQELGRAFVHKVLDARTDAQDLAWTFDAVARLAKAQVLGAMGRLEPIFLQEQLDPRHFLAPAALWWAFDWESANTQAQLATEIHVTIPSHPPGWTPTRGCVVLLDEMDKADSAVPNGLLEALGEGEIAVPAGGGDLDRIKAGEVWPLIVITTNEERALPDAFLRRCIVLPLALPVGDDELIAWLVERGRAHFPDRFPDALLEEAATILASDRKQMKRRDLSAPGQAEYLDLLRAVDELAGALDRSPQEVLKQVASFTLIKHSGEA